MGKWVAAAVALIAIAGMLLSWPHLGRKVETLSVARISLPMEALVYVAEAQGFCEDEGVEIRYQSFRTGRECLDTVLRGENDLATVYTTPLVMDACAGEDLCILTTLHTSTRSTAIVARRESGIRTPSDLVGRTVAVAPRTSGVVFLSLFLIANGLTTSDVTTVDMPIDRSEEFLAAGKVDAIVTWYPYLSNLLASHPSGALTVLNCDVYREISVLAGRREVIQRKQVAIRRMLRALLRAEQFLRDHPHDGRKQVAEAINAGTLPPDSPVWDEFAATLGLNHVLLQTMDEEVDLLAPTGECKVHSGFRGAVFDGPLRDLAPESVTLPRERAAPASIRMPDHHSGHELPVQ